jgi:hypothetical protein
MPDGEEQPDTGLEERNEASVPGPRRVLATLKTLGPALVGMAPLSHVDNRVNHRHPNRGHHWP